MVLHHGTSLPKLEKILAEGQLRPRRKGEGNWELESRRGYVYLTDAYAGYFSLCAAGDENEEGLQPVVLEVEVDERKLRPDEDFIGQVLHNQEEFLEVDLKTLTASVDIEVQPELWRQSLENLGTVAHRGAIKVARFRRAVVSGDRRLWSEFHQPTISLMNYRFCGPWYKRLTRLLFGEEEEVRHPLHEAYEAAGPEFALASPPVRCAGRTVVTDFSDPDAAMAALRDGCRWLD